jgi:hypothetical protein
MATYAEQLAQLNDGKAMYEDYKAKHQAIVDDITLDIGQKFSQTFMLKLEYEKAVGLVIIARAKKLAA